MHQHAQICASQEMNNKTLTIIVTNNNNKQQLVPPTPTQQQQQQQLVPPTLTQQQQQLVPPTPMQQQQQLVLPPPMSAMMIMNQQVFIGVLLLLRRAARRIRADFAARAQAAAARFGINRGDDNDDHDAGGGGGDEFEDICPITHEPALDPVTLGNSIQVYSRRALGTWIELQSQRSDSITNPYTRETYQIEEVFEHMHPVTGDRLSRIMAERRRLNLPLTADDEEEGGRDERGESASEYDESSGDDLLRGDLPPAQRRRTENGHVNVPPNQRQFGGFVDENGQMRSPEYEQAFLNLAQTAGNHEGGLVGSWGYGRRTAYFEAHTHSLFSSTGPLSDFRSVGPGRLQMHVSRVIAAANQHWNRTHSAGEGEDLEAVPEWARVLFPLFDGVSERESARRAHQAIVRGVSGAQAPIGHDQGNNAPVQLRNERSQNDGAPELRQRTVGDVDVQREQVEGRDDHANRMELGNGGRNRNRTRHRNILLPRDEDRQNHDLPDHDYAGRRADDIRYGFGSLRMLVSGINQAIVQQPRRNAYEIYDNIRNIQHDRRSASPGMLPVIDMAMEALTHELMDAMPHEEQQQQEQQQAEEDDANES